MGSSISSINTYIASSIVSSTTAINQNLNNYALNTSVVSGFSNINNDISSLSNNLISSTTKINNDIFNN